MMSTLNVVYRVRETRSWIRARAIALGLTLAISILLLCAMIIVLVGGYLFDLVGAQIYLGSTIALLWKALEWPTALLFVVISFSSIYYFGPDRPERYWHSEASHRGIVPMNHSNQDGTSSAESEEGTLRIKGTLVNLTRARHRAGQHACPRD
jgi:hypothetical protein